MAYFMVERSRDDGTLSIPLPDAYETRDAAITALAAATSSGTISLLGEVFIADLGSAVPVLVMPSAPAAAPPVAEDAPMREPVAEVVEEPEVEPAESPVEEGEEPGELDEAGGDSAFTAWEPLAEITAAESTLADALKRAASSLEDEGIVAPDSIVSGEEPVTEESAAIEEEPQEAEPVESEESPSADEGSDDTAAWPWANVESYEIKVDAAGLVEPEEDTLDSELANLPSAPEAEPEDDEAATVEVVPEEQAIITSAPAEGEEAFMPHPVILGDYLDSVSAAVEGEPEEAAASAEIEEPVLESPDESEPEEPEEPEAAAVVEPAESEAEEVEPLEPVAADAVEDATSPSAHSVPEVGYEATGELKLEEYTCQDCVYSNTCPKVGQTTPAECGSFQWRSE